MLKGPAHRDDEGMPAHRAEAQRNQSALKPTLDLSAGTLADVRVLRRHVCCRVIQGLLLWGPVPIGDSRALAFSLGVEI